MRRALVVLAVAAAVPWSAACGSCDVACIPAADDTPVVEATVVDADVEVVGFRLADGTEQDVRVFGEAADLESGTTYRVPLAPPSEASELPTAQLPGDCDCGGPYITNVDGSAVEVTGGLPTGLWRTSVLAIGGFAVAVLVWGLLRYARGKPVL